jgi:hypothetical protein
MAAIIRLGDLECRILAGHAIQRELAAASMQGMEQQRSGHQTGDDWTHDFPETS